MRGSTLRENRETLHPPTADGAVGRDGKSEDQAIDERSRESDCPVVPTKPPNKGGGSRSTELWPT